MAKRLLLILAFLAPAGFALAQAVPTPPAVMGLMPNRYLWVDRATGHKYASASVKVFAHTTEMNMVTFDDDTGVATFRAHVKHQKFAGPLESYWIENDGSDYVPTN